MRCLPNDQKSLLGNPTHEMVHAMTCSVMGSPAFHRVSDWFHEETAELVRIEHEPRLVRIFNRMRVWLAGENNLPSHSAPTGTPIYEIDATTRQAYYRCGRNRSNHVKVWKLQISHSPDARTPRIRENRRSYYFLTPTQHSDLLVKVLAVFRTGANTRSVTKE